MPYIKEDQLAFLVSSNEAYWGAAQELREEVESMTRLLASTCRVAESAEVLSRLPRSTQAWCNRYKQTDRTRRNANRRIKGAIGRLSAHRPPGHRAR